MSWCMTAGLLRTLSTCLLTLACCKPKIRRNAGVGDIIVGLSSRCERIVYAARVDEVIGFEAVLGRPPIPSAATEDGRGSLSSTARATVSTSRSRAGTANCTRCTPTPMGQRSPDNKQTDLGRPPCAGRERFTYWGGSGPASARRARVPHRSGAATAHASRTSRSTRSIAGSRPYQAAYWARPLNGSPGMRAGVNREVGSEPQGFRLRRGEGRQPHLRRRFDDSDADP